jgi:hypothetical protein
MSSPNKKQAQLKKLKTSAALLANDMETMDTNINILAKADISKTIKNTDIRSALEIILDFVHDYKQEKYKLHSKLLGQIETLEESLE